MQELEASVIHTGLHFGEGPRWRVEEGGGALYFSDFYRHGVFRFDPAAAEGGRERLVVTVEGQPSGLGWMPDGSMLVVSMLDRTVRRFDGTALTLHADLSAVATFHANDMVVDAAGRAYVGNFGFDLHAMRSRADLRPAALALVQPDGHVSVAADDLLFPNGTVITPDGGTLIVGESMGRRFTAFDIDPASGSLSNRRLWADIGPHAPDGCALDAEGAIWVADPTTRPGEPGLCLRVREGGEILGRVRCRQQAYACALGGADRRTLFVLTAPASQPADVDGAAAGCIEMAQVDAPGAGRP